MEGVRGQARVHMELIIRFDYGSIVPWVRNLDGTLSAVAGPDALYLHTPVSTHGEGLTTVADFTVSAGDRISFALTWSPSNVPFSTPADAERSLVDTEQYWKE